MLRIGLMVPPGRQHVGHVERLRVIGLAMLGAFYWVRDW